MQINIKCICLIVKGFQPLQRIVQANPPAGSWRRLVTDLARAGIRELQLQFPLLNNCLEPDGTAIFID